MMYSTSRLYYYIRDGAKTSAIDNQIVQMEPGEESRNWKWVGGVIYIV